VPLKEDGGADDGVQILVKLVKEMSSLEEDLQAAAV
jgi:hypothetical protein